MLSIGFCSVRKFYCRFGEILIKWKQKNIELTNPTYRFGKGKIGVGTEKSVIEQVYRSSYQGLQQDVYGQYFVEDGNCLIYFYFDDRDIVNMIRVSEAEIILEDNEAYAREFQNAR